ncbi:MAG: hypothetical protein LKKZDAJK_000140 [Candidatus Fervidibacter sp.]
MSETQDKVAQALEMLRKALEEERERLNDPAVSELVHLLRNDRLTLVEWMLNEVGRLEGVWREGKAPTSGKTCTKRHEGRRLPRGESLPRDFYRPLILKALAEMGGQGRAKEVLRRVFEMAKPSLSDKDLELVPSGTSKRWEKRANWERYQMVQEGLLRSDSPQGIWELSEKGWEEAKRLLEQ